jgi:hypothetical protein
MLYINSVRLIAKYLFLTYLWYGGGSGGCHHGHVYIHFFLGSWVFFGSS